MPNKYLTFLSITGVILTVVLLHFISVLRPLENTVISMVNLGSSKAYNFSNWIGGKTKLIFGREQLIEELDYLRDELQKYNFDQVVRKRLEDENNKLRRQLNFLSNFSYGYIGADVIGRDINPLSTSLLINQGSLAGIKENDPVIVGKGLLVGKVAQVYEDSSIIRLINDNNSSIAATVMNKDQSIGLVEGGFSLSLHMNFIPQNEMINKNDMVITSGLEEGMPRGLLLGEVQVIEKSPQESFQHSVLKPAANLDRISVVSVLIKLE